MNSRTLSILEAAIKEHIQTGKPVSSAELYKNNRFGIKPAMIRSELNQLTKSGFLKQPHTSGGRVPTDKGYQILADSALENLKNLRSGLAIRKFLDDRLDSLIADVSRQLHLLSVGYLPEGKEVYKSGLGDLVQQLGVEEKQGFLDVVEDFERLDERMDSMFRLLDGDSPQVFIGKSPVTRSPHLSVIADIFEGDEGNFLLMAIGPTRMDYQKVLGWFKELKENNE